MTTPTPQPPIPPVDLVVKTANPKALDDTIQQLPMCAAAVVDGSFDGETCRVRVFSGLDFLRFAMTNQGYGEIVAEVAANASLPDDPAPEASVGP